VLVARSSLPARNSATESNGYETGLACRDGAVEIDGVINIGKALRGIGITSSVTSRRWATKPIITAPR